MQPTFHHLTIFSWLQRVGFKRKVLHKYFSCSTCIDELTGAVTNHSKTVHKIWHLNVKLHGKVADAIV